MTPCEPWTGYIATDGYGRYGRGGRAHVRAYELAHGPVPAGLELDHLCRNRACVNPAHLEAVTHAENIRRAVRPDPTRCGAGLHDWTPENIGRQSGGRGGYCKPCHEAAHRRRMADPVYRAKMAAKSARWLAKPGNMTRRVEANRRRRERLRAEAAS